MKYLLLVLALCLVGCGETIQPSPETEDVIIYVTDEPEPLTDEEFSDLQKAIKAGDETTVNAISKRHAEKEEKRQKERKRRRRDDIEPVPEPMPDIPTPTPDEQKIDRKRPKPSPDKEDKQKEKEEKKREKEKDKEEHKQERKDKVELAKEQRAARWGTFLGHFSGAAGTWTNGGILGILWHPFSTIGSFISYILWCSWYFIVACFFMFLVLVGGSIYLLVRLIRSFF